MKKYTQFGTFIIVVFGTILFFETVALFKTGISTSPESIGQLFACLLLLACLLGFYKLTILIDKDGISFKFGMGWFGKKYSFSNISSCEAVRNQWIYGIGIHWVFTGWLYNVSGSKAIELRFKDKKSVVRIGTDKPEEICGAVREKLSRTS